MASGGNLWNGALMNKPTVGWLHDDDQLLPSAGVTYSVRYIGCIEVLVSMKALDFETRTNIAKACINLVCEQAGFRAGGKKRKFPKSVQKSIAEQAILKNAGDVGLTITTDRLSIENLVTYEQILSHEMPGISFASGGDTDTMEFVAYVAKDTLGRFCHVLECGDGLTQDVITTIGQAFELRFKEYLRQQQTPIGQISSAHEPLRGELMRHENEIELANSTANVRRPDSKLSALDPAAIERDAFDAKPFVAQPSVDELLCIKKAAQSSPQRLEDERWYHGPISRKEVEELLRGDGDFLVRASTTTPGQYVLSGNHKNVVRHLLLIDPEGVVRTKDRTFDNVSHLINHHMQTGLPIVSNESELQLRTPVFAKSA